MSDSSKVRLIVKYAETLRDAGVSHFELTETGMSVWLHPKIDSQQPYPVKPEEEDDPLGDPWTFGGELPGYQRGNKQ